MSGVAVVFTAHTSGSAQWNSPAGAVLGPKKGPRLGAVAVDGAPQGHWDDTKSSKGAVGNCVTTMVHNHYPPSEKAPPPPKSSNHTAPSLNNIVKATTGEGESCSFGKAQKNVARSNHAVQSNSGGAAGQLRRKEFVAAGPFIRQVTQAAATIQRWYRHQVQRRRAGAASVQCLLESKQAQQRQTLLEQHQQKEAARRRAREEKARQARRAAIQELQQKRAQKSGNTDLGLLKGTRETGKPQPTQELPLSPGSAAQETRKASNAGRPVAEEEDASSQDTAAGEILEVVAPTEGRAKSRATLDDLLDTLKLLEQEPEPLPRPRAYLKDKYAWTDEVTVGPGTIHAVSGGPWKAGLESAAAPTASNATPHPLQEDYASSLTAHNLERLTPTPGGSWHGHSWGLVAKLIEDKKALGEKCEALVAELKQGDQRRKDREAQMQEQHELEIKKLKELMSATEKVRREKWISEKTRKIKEITVKGEGLASCVHAAMKRADHLEELLEQHGRPFPSAK
ncbi:hypothetical protein CB1_000462004 [Camelus ferus]|nr:hypothetical protein CB1_000462004 [Camelus ferus]